MNAAIEIHDSTVIRITNRDGEVIVHFQPAYLHKSEGRPGFDSGTGWTQEARLVFSEGATSGDFPDWPCELMDGELHFGSERHNNLIPVPLQVAMPTQLRLVCDAFHTVTVTGKAARLELVGEPKFV
jgi:hypothetical protein